MITILQNITGFLTNIDPQAIVLEDEISTINILTKLKADSNIDDIINKVHTFFIQKNRTKVMIFMDNYKQLRLPEELDKIIKKYSLIDTEYIDYADNLIIDTVSDLKEIVLGNNTKNYDGSPNKEQQEEIHAEDEEYLLPIDENETEIETNIADVLTSLTALTASEISEIHKFTDGVKDILIKVIPILLKISYISGLPFDTKKICELLSNNILFESRRSQILKELPDIAESLIEIIINQTKYEDAISFIHDIDNVNIVTKLQDIYPRIYKSWDKECNKCIIESLTIWWLDLLESSLRGNLKFNIFDGYIQYASYWNKFGPPLQPKATSGILIYLVNISSEILEEYDSDKSDLRKSIETFANEKYKDKLNELLDLWKEIKDTEIVEDNFEKAKMSLIETIKQLQQKNKPKNYVSSFINAFLYLPEYFPKKSKSIKNASWAQGCCLTKLDENYQSDADWRDFASLTQLLKIKNGLSKNKFIGTRANYYYFSKKPRKESEATEATEAREGGPSKPHLKPSKIVIPEKEKQQEKESKVIFEKIDCTAMNQEDEKDKENVAKNKEFIWLPKSIKNDSSKMKKTTEAMLKSIFTIKNASIMSKIFENIMSISHSISILNIIISSLQKYKTNSFVNGILVYCKEMKDYINILDQDDITLSKYILAKALCYPCNFDISKSKLVLPSGITEDIYPSIKKDHIKHIVEWDKSRTVMNDEEIKEYLNTMREKQKDIILDNLNAIEDNDEKQLLSEMKNFGLISYTDIYKKQNDEEIVVEEHYLDEDLVGESDFAMESTDPDQNNEEDLP